MAASRKAQKLAESYADRALEKMPVAFKAFGTRDMLISMALPSAELAVSQDKAVRNVTRMLETVKSQAQHSALMLEREGTALDRIERIYQRSIPEPRPRFDDFVTGPDSIPHANGHERHM